MKARIWLTLCAAALVLGCTSESEPRRSDADVPMLFMGNSHTARNGLPDTVAALVGSTRPGETVESVRAPDYGFLEDHYHNATTLSMLRGQDWSFVVLQAQKYSTSGCCVYSTAEAKALIRIAREQHAVPIMFPEWPRLGVDETARIYDLHVSIAQDEPACVAPIPQAFDLALARDPGLTLHDSDGNHSSPNGAFLAALILAATITGVSPLDYPVVPRVGVTTQAQAFLRQVAADTVAAWPPRQWCPDDPYPTTP